MANILWITHDHETLPTKIQQWLSSADRDSALLLTNLTEADFVHLSTIPELENTQWETYDDGDGGIAMQYRSNLAREFESRRASEHRELLLVLQAALIDVAERDQELASKLAARAYVNLKTDPIGQRRFDGLLHRFTGVLHRRSTLDPSPPNFAHVPEKTQDEK